MRSTTALLGLATTGTGLVAGLFVAFSVAVMPGLHHVDDRAYVLVMQRINVSIVNPLFLLLFMGTPVLLVVLAALDRRLPVLLAAGLTVVALVVTFAINIPLNDALAAADASTAATAARQAFEKPWVVANVVRTLLMTGSFVACLMALRSAG